MFEPTIPLGVGMDFFLEPHNTSNKIPYSNVPLLSKFSRPLDLFCTDLYMPLVPEPSFCEPSIM